MIHFEPYRTKEISFTALVAGLSKQELKPMTHEMVETMLQLIEDCEDADVTFVPEDPAAYDPYAEDPAEEKMPWTLGHVIVHTTASAEESAFLAAEMARGVDNHGRSRYEIPWRRMTNIKQCRDRLEESRRMRIASLEIWPEKPHLEVSFHPSWMGGETVNAVGRFVLGLLHDDSHLDHIREIVRQASAARQ